MTRHTRSLFITLAITALLAAGGTLTQASSLRIQDLAALERVAIEEVERQAPGSTAEVSPLDPRLQLAACDKPLQASLPPQRHNRPAREPPGCLHCGYGSVVSQCIRDGLDRNGGCRRQSRLAYRQCDWSRRYPDRDP